jgi:acetylornithine/succinyldiaminopimelate/putrescine aminotransferase
MLRLLPPLIIDEADVAEALERLATAIAGSDSGAV